jgi:hypothetical protein
VRRLQRGTLLKIGIGVACLVVLGIIYQYQRHPATPDSKAVTTVKSELAVRGVAVDSVTCKVDSLDPSKLPAIAQVASLHKDETPFLYDCSAVLSGQPKAGDPGSDRSWCVLGFSGSAPWLAYSTQHRCASMTRTA